MKLGNLGTITERKSVNFGSKRTLRNAVSQLAKNNRYSLTEPNQRYITNSIKELSQIKGNKNIGFLLETAAKSAYSTNIVLQDIPKNNWKMMLVSAAAAVMAITPFVPEEFKKKIAELSKPQALSNDEKEILKLREQLLAVVDLEQINNETKGPMKNFQKNLDYFIVSSETTIEHKKYVLEQLNYFMSDDYKINPQLEDKKSIVIAEMINDMTISAPGNEPPNMKAVNQKQHGMCAAISIVRKKVAYEDKPNYVDAIISELDNTNSIIVYDRNELGSGKKTVVSKVPVDFKTAMENGYRIIDASTMHWMFIAQMSGENNLAYSNYTPFDHENFDVKTDTFLNAKIDDPILEKIQDYYQAILYANKAVENYKANKIKKEEKALDIKLAQKDTLKELNSILNELDNELRKILPNLNKEDIIHLRANILKLEHPTSEKIKNNKFEYIPNEEAIVKKAKIKDFIENEYKNIKISTTYSDKIFELVDSYNNLVKINSPSSSKGSKISHAKKLYEIASSFRYMTIKGLDTKQILDNAMLDEDLLDRESLLLDHIDILIEELENNSPDSELIIKQISPMFDESVKTKEDVIPALQNLKIILHEFLTEHLDDMYKALTLKGRHDAISKFLENSIENIEQGDYKSMKLFAENFKFEPTIDSVIQGLKEIKAKIDAGDEETYINTLYSLGHTSQLEYLAKLHQSVIDKLSDENVDNDDFIMDFLSANGLSIEDNENAVVQRLEDIKTKLNSINDFISICIENLRVVDENNNVLYSAKPKDIIIRKYEEAGIIASYNQLKELQDHFTKIAKEKSSDEFQSRQGKLKNKDLYKFTKTELETLKNTEKNINAIYAKTKRELKNTQRENKEAFETLNNAIGLNTGNFWVFEGESGLSSEMDIRILEYMTGRPHYSSKNIKKAIEKIKTGPYSGITSSSVYHDQSGMHAQYIADIKPVKVQIKDDNGNVKEETRDVLFHDNTWGASEKENTWIDSQGLLRTDYSDNRGGTLGYITNEKFQNGNFVDRILNEMIVVKKADKTKSKIYKKIKHPEENVYEFPQYNGFILDGQAPKAKDIGDRIHDAIFVPSIINLEHLSKLGEKYNEAEIKSMIEKTNLVGQNWRPDYEAILKRIMSNSIKTEEDYNNLANNDYLKVVLEKIALKRRYQTTGIETNIAKAKTVEELNSFKKSQNQRAINEVNYVFNKDANLIDYLAESYPEELDDKIEAIFNKYDINPSDEDAKQLVTFKINADNYNGSAKDAIEEMLHYKSEIINKITKNKNARIELYNVFKNAIEEMIYFNHSDLDMYKLENQNFEYIIKFIDREFNPEDDDDFVKIFRKIQDMTKEEFKKEILSKMKPEDLGLKEVSGYEILKEIQNYKSSSRSSLKNTIYYDSVVKETDEKDVKFKYKFKRFHRKPTYLKTKDFDSAYFEIKNDLSLLTFTKLFNQYKGENLDKYKAYPAYPKVNHLSDDFAHSSFDSIIDIIKQNSIFINQANTQLANYNIADTLLGYINSVDKNVKIVGQDFKTITEILGNLITMNNNDSSMDEILECAENALSLDEGAKWEEYLPYLTEIVTRIKEFEATAPIDNLFQLIDSAKTKNEASKYSLVKSLVQPRYQSKLMERLNEYEKFIQNNNKDSEYLENIAFEEFKKYHLNNDPEKLFDLYLTSLAKDSENHMCNQTYRTLLEHCLAHAQQAEIQSIIMDGLNDGVAINAKDKFNQHIIDFGKGPVSMASGESIAFMTHSLIIKDNFQTALMFLDKLGLAEQYIDYMHQDLDYDDIKNLLNKAHEITSNFKKFKDSSNIAFQDFTEMMSEKTLIDRDFDRLISIIENDVKEYSMGKETAIIFKEAINLFKNNYYNKAQSSAPYLFNTILNEAKNQVSKLCLKNVQDIDLRLEQTTHLMNFINKIILEEDSKAWNQRLEINAEYDKIITYRDDLYKDLQV